MGMFDSFLVPNFTCPSCGNVYEADFQTKQFGRLLDYVKVGEDVRTPREMWWLYKDNLIDDTFTESKAHELVASDPKKYRYSEHMLGGRKYIRVSHFLGSAPPNFSNIKSCEFGGFDICPKCKKGIEATGIIEDYLFKGVKDCTVRS